MPYTHYLSLFFLQIKNASNKKFKAMDQRVHKIHISANKNSGTIKSFQSKYTNIYTYSATLLIFFHPDCTVGFGISPNHALRLVGCTTGREFHPALKMLFN